MATNITQEKKMQHLEEEEEEIEALSLCDLPINLTDEEDQSKARQESRNIETQEDFDFRLWGGAPFSTESEMCIADEVFFQGQILPLHLKRCESMDHVSVREFRSNSSRSQNSSSSSCSTATTTPRIENQNHFHTHPSPQPQLKVTVPRQTSFGNQGRKSSAWEIFRLGVVPAPEIALQDLKIRSSNGTVNKNNIGRSNSIGTNAATRSYSNSGKKNHVFKFKGFWSGCKCSVETAQPDTVMIKGGTKSGNNTTESATHATKEKVLERKRQKQRQKQGKRTMSRRRTFEWLKELSHISYPYEEALLSKS